MSSDVKNMTNDTNNIKNKNDIKNKNASTFDNNFIVVEINLLKKMKNSDFNPKMFEIQLDFHIFAVHKDLLLIRNRNDNLMKIYKFNGNFTLKLIRSFSNSSIIFLERYLFTNDMQVKCSNSSVNLMYKIMLDLISKNIEMSEIEKYLSELMDRLRFDQIESVKYSTETITISYSHTHHTLRGVAEGAEEGGKAYHNHCHAYFNSNLVEIDKPEEDSKTMKVKVKDDYIIVKFDKMEILKKKVGKVISMDFTDENVFIQQEGKLKIMALI
jgi:hypothetical protein